tara:strand:- start:1427 stop:3349 length:1923 start_codon:yes stop_codon:yes gene_type:complete
MNNNSQTMAWMAEALSDALLHDNLDHFLTLFRKTMAVPAADFKSDTLGQYLFQLLPKSSNQFVLVAPAFPGRNDPCFCGSGKKLKKCCVALSDFPLPVPADLFLLALSAMNNQQLLALAEKPGWTAAAAALFCEHAMTEMAFDAVVTVGRYLTCEPAKLRNEHQELVSTLFDALLEVQLDDERFALMQQLTECKRAPSVQSVAYQRLAMFVFEQGQAAEARQYLQQAMRLDPDQYELPMTELTILCAVAEDAEVRARAKFWQARLQKKYQQGTPILEFVNQVVKEGKALYLQQLDRIENLLDAREETAALALADPYIVNVEKVLSLFERSENTFTGSACDFKVVKGEASRILKAEYRQDYKAWIQQLGLMEQDCLSQAQRQERRLGDDHFREMADDMRWLLPDTRWIDILRQAPALLNHIEVIQRLTDMAQPLPYPEADDTADSPNQLSCFGIFRMILGFKRREVLMNICLSLPAELTLPGRLKANQPFWDLAYDYYLDCCEHVDGDVDNEDMLEQLVAREPATPVWLQEALALVYLKQQKSEQLVALVRGCRRTSVACILMQAYALQLQQQPQDALACIQQLLVRNRKFLRQLKMALAETSLSPLENTTLVTFGQILLEDNDNQAVVGCRQWLLRHLPS